MAERSGDQLERMPCAPSKSSRKNQRRQWVPHAEIVNEKALLAAEDKALLPAQRHRRGMIRAFIGNLAQSGGRPNRAAGIEPSTAYTLLRGTPATFTIDKASSKLAMLCNIKTS